MASRKDPGCVGLRLLEACHIKKKCDSCPSVLLVSLHKSELSNFKFGLHIVFLACDCCFVISTILSAFLYVRRLQWLYACIFFAYIYWVLPGIKLVVSLALFLSPLISSIDFNLALHILLEL